ncbi:hypothetical protein [Vitiosangium sp. GDMCC 1.1324]|uniref:hypothetical protein n=1 Tax=Vitiosangium sp. (strain GDMCC 1.1324) TaxID=2138576 RepID=UPI000D367D1F|nr:hypothetical protein [Vitiosangium sp. GDMCC 1.1324]PTL83374.1 hypothetical protein DAT35_15470 [Vitiosangium sp. GDMCC 1.1324]
MFKSIGGKKPSLPSIQAPRTPASSSSVPAPATPQARTGSSSPGSGDGFSGSSSSAVGYVPAKTIPMPPPKAPGGTNVSANLASNPVMFTANNVLNVNNTVPPPGLPLPTPNQTFVPAAHSTVTVNAYQHNPGDKTKVGNANLAFNPEGGQGLQAHYLHYLSADMGRYAGISGVPQHPPPGAPTTIITGQLNGCAVHAFHDKNTQTLSFVHHADFSKNGQAELADFLRRNPNLQHAATLGPADYSHPTSMKLKDGTPLATGATVFAQYERPRPAQPGQPAQQGQWVMVGQLHQQKPNAYQEGRPELMRPDFSHLAEKPSQFLYVPVPPPRDE